MSKSNYLPLMKNIIEEVFGEEKHDEVEYVTGFIMYCMDDAITPDSVWRSTGRKIVIRIEQVCELSLIEKRVGDAGYCLGRGVRVVFYGKPLKRLVGSRKYNIGEKKELVPLLKDDPFIMLAIPDCDESPCNPIAIKETDVYDIIAGLNSGKLKVHHLRGMYAKELSRIIDIAKHEGKRIKNPAVFHQICRLAKRKREEESLHTPANKSTVELINAINRGDIATADYLTDNQVVSILDLIWCGSAPRIDKCYKHIYHELKKRYPYCLVA